MSFLKFTMQTTAVRIISVFIVMTCGVINARWLGVDGVGVLVLLSLIPNFAFHYGNLGFGSSMAYYIARKKVSLKQSVQIVFLIGSVLSILSVLLFLLIWKRDFSPLNDINPSYIFLYLPTIPLIFFINFIQRILSGQLRIPETNKAILLGNFVSITCIILFVIVFEIGLKGAILAVVISQACTFLYLTARLKRVKDEPPEKEINKRKIGSIIWEFWNYGKWNYLLMFLNYFNSQLPLFFLKKIILTNSSVGIYSKALGLGEQSQIVSDPIAKMLFPFTASSDTPDAVNRTNLLCRNSIILMSLVVSMMVICAKPLIVFLYGAPFLPSAHIFYFIAPGVIFWPTSQFLEIHIAASGNPKAVFIVSLLSTIITIVICWFFIGKYGVVGAGLSMSLKTFVSIILRVFIYRKLFAVQVSQVLLPQKSDLSYYQEIFDMLIIKIIKYKNIRKKV